MSATEAQLNIGTQLYGSASIHARRLTAIVRQFSPWVLVLPIAATLSVTDHCYYYCWGVSTSSDYVAFGIALSVVGFVTATTCWVLRGDFFHRWLIYLTGCLWCRAIHLAGSELGAAVAIAILIWYALVRYDDLRAYLESRLLVSLLAGGLACQCLQWLVATDASLWLIHVGIWPQRLETAMMLLGRTMLLAAVVGSEVMHRTGRITSAGNGRTAEAAILSIPAAESADLATRKAA